MAVKLRKVEYVPYVLVMYKKIHNNYSSGTPDPFTPGLMPGEWFSVVSNALVAVDPNVAPTSEYNPKAVTGYMYGDTKIDNLTYNAIMSYIRDEITPANPSPSDERYDLFVSGDNEYCLPAKEVSCPTIVRLWTIAYYSLNDSDTEEAWVPVISKTPDEVVFNALNDYPVYDVSSMRVLSRTAAECYLLGTDNSIYIDALEIGGWVGAFSAWGGSSNTLRELIFGSEERGIESKLDVLGVDKVISDTINLPHPSDMSISTDSSTYSFTASVGQGFSRYYPHVTSRCNFFARLQNPIDTSIYPGYFGYLSMSLKEVDFIKADGTPSLNSIVLAEDEYKFAYPDVNNISFSAPKKNYIIYTNPGSLPISVVCSLSFGTSVPLDDISIEAVCPAGSSIYTYSQSSREWAAAPVAEDIALTLARLSERDRTDFSVKLVPSFSVEAPIGVGGDRGAARLIPVELRCTIDSTTYTASINVMVNAQFATVVEQGTYSPESQQNMGKITSGSFDLCTFMPFAPSIGQEEQTAAFGYNRMVVYCASPYTGKFEAGRMQSITKGKTTTSTVFDGSSTRGVTAQSGVVYSIKEPYSLVAPFELLLGSNLYVEAEIQSDGLVGSSMPLLVANVYQYTYSGGIGVQLSDNTFFPVNADATVGKIVTLKETV